MACNEMLPIERGRVPHCAAGVDAVPLQRRRAASAGERSSGARSAAGDVHRDFETEAKVGIGGGSPLHACLLEVSVDERPLHKCGCFTDRKLHAGGRFRWLHGAHVSREGVESGMNAGITLLHRFSANRDLRANGRRRDPAFDSATRGVSKRDTDRSGKMRSRKCAVSFVGGVALSVKQITVYLPFACQSH